MSTEIPPEAAIHDAETEAAFITEAVYGGSYTTACEMMFENPKLGRANIYAACVSGDAEAVAAFLSVDPALATAKGGPNGWEPLLYLCFALALSREPESEANMLQIASILLEKGANPNAFFLGEPPRSERLTALCGASGIANHPPLTQLLLEAGADPNDGRPDFEGSETFYRTAGFRDITCLELLLQRNVSPAVKAYGLKRKLDFEDIDSARLLLECGANPNLPHPNVAYGGAALHHAIDRWRSLDIIRLLVRYGADVNQAADQGVTPYALAVRLGRAKVARFLEECGADNGLSYDDLVFAACARADAEMAQEIKRQSPAILERLSGEDLKALAKAAKENRLEAVQTMLDAGFDIAAPEGGLTALHWAAWFGHAEMTALLLTYSPPLEETDCFGHTPLETAVIASLCCHEAALAAAAEIGPDTERGLNYLRIVDMLITAGAALKPSMQGHGAPVVDKLVRESLFRHEFLASRK